MTLPGTESPKSTCGAECGSCHMGREWSQAEAALPQGQGRALLIGSLLFFLFPAFLSFLGAWLGRSSGTGQLLGGLAGLGAGMGLARWLGPLFGPGTSSNPKPSPAPRMEHDQNNTA